MQVDTAQSVMDGALARVLWACNWFACMQGGGAMKALGRHDINWMEEKTRRINSGLIFSVVCAPEQNTTSK